MPRIIAERRRRNWNRERLAQECKKVDPSSDPARLSAAAITSIETGRRAKDGRRRREISVDELVVIARALDVPPVLLLFPLGKQETVEVLPDRHLKVWSALRWFDGQAPFPRSSEDRHAASDTFAAWRQNSAPIDLFARHADQLERVAAQEDDQEAVAALKETRLTMHRLGLAPPELPEGLPELNGVES